MTQDEILLKACTEDEVSALFIENLPVDMEFPLDETIIGSLKDLKTRIEGRNDDSEIFRHQDVVDKLWAQLLDKAIKCLRYYDEREPFKHDGDGKGDKKPLAYGIHALKEYYKKYTEFERVLYGSSRYYRDHVIHVFRVWLSGIDQLTRNKGRCLENFDIKDAGEKIVLHPREKISMWTIIALTHDLGYPLEKARGILSVTREMLSTFVTNPDISADFAFHGAQNQMNDMIVRLMSSKMIRRDELYGSPATMIAKGQQDSGEAVEKAESQENDKDRKHTGKDKPFVVRLQHKYYLKFLKSLENNKHGILSTLIIGKILKYFLESDYSINENYGFNEEDRRQFYIRREILRSIAAHTCDDIYQMYMGSFSFLLRICDDTQEWGRKYITELYTASREEHQPSNLELSFGTKGEMPDNRCEVSETVTVTAPEDMQSMLSLIERFYSQSLVYMTVFRDGQDTEKRDFSFYRTQTISDGYIKIELKLEITREKRATLCVTVTGGPVEKKNKEYKTDLCEKLCTKFLRGTETSENLEIESPISGYKDRSGNQTEDDNIWRTYELSLPLVNESGYL